MIVKVNKSGQILIQNDYRYRSPWSLVSGNNRNRFTVVIAKPCQFPRPRHACRRKNVDGSWMRAGPGLDG